MERRTFLNLSGSLAVGSLANFSFVGRPEDYVEASVMGDGSLKDAGQWVEYCRKTDRRPPVKIWAWEMNTSGPGRQETIRQKNMAEKLNSLGSLCAMSPRT